MSSLTGSSFVFSSRQVYKSVPSKKSSGQSGCNRRNHFGLCILHGRQNQGIPRRVIGVAKVFFFSLCHKISSHYFCDKRAQLYQHCEYALSTQESMCKKSPRNFYISVHWFKLTPSWTVRTTKLLFINARRRGLAVYGRYRSRFP